MRRSTLVALTLLLSSNLGGQATSYSLARWDKSPEAYFLTPQEQSDWTHLAADTRRRLFIGDYFARRGPHFRSMLEERVAIANKYFSSGAIKGAETLRGKVIIVFGPPSSFHQTDPTSKERPLSDRGDLAYVNAHETDPHAKVGPGGAGLIHEMTDSIFTIVYEKAETPPAIGVPFRVDLKFKSAAKQEALDQKGLQEKFDIMAATSILP
jgi:GWxTD domain-containing protein